MGMMAVVSRDKVASRIKSIKSAGADVAPKLDQLRRLRDELWAVDSVLLDRFIPSIIDLLSDRLSPVRKFVTQIIGEIGLKHLELLTGIIPALIDVLKDDTPAVARQAIKCGVDIFRCFLVKVSVQGSYSSEFNESLKLSWACVLKFKDEICLMAFKVGSDGRRLSALKFVESVVLLYTPDPNGLLEPPSDQMSEGTFEEFNVSWLRGGHPILNVRDLSAEATRNLGLLLDQLRFPSFKTHSYLVIIVLIKSLSTIARKRPTFYGRILPVLLGLDPSKSTSKGMHLAGVYHALKNAFESCLNCTYPGAAPWKDRLVNALKELQLGKPTERPDTEISKNNRKTEKTGDLPVAQIHEDEKPSAGLMSEQGNASRKRTGVSDSSEVTVDEMSVKRARSTPDKLEGPRNEMSGKQDKLPSPGPTLSRADVDNGPVQQLVAMFSALVAQGEKAEASLDILICSISADLLAEVVMANIWNLPLKCPKSEEDGVPLVNMDAHPDVSASDSHIKHLSLLLSNILSQPNSSTDKDNGIEDPHLAASSELELAEGEEPHATLGDDIACDDDLDNIPQKTIVSVSESASPKDIPSAMEVGLAGINHLLNDNEGMASEIPGLGFSTREVGLLELVDVFSKEPSDLGDINLAVLDDTNKEISTNLDSTPIELDTNPIELNGVPMEVAQSLSTDRSEELSPKASATQDASNISSSTATSVGFSSQLILPKISAPVIHLADEHKDQLQQVAFVRIIDAYKQVTVAGGSQVRFSILAYSGLEFPSELDPWKLLKEHILSDYVNNEVIW